MTYMVLSPDDLPIEPRGWRTRAAAERALADWCLRFMAQGYYRTATGEGIPVEVLPERCRIVKEDKR